MTWQTVSGALILILPSLMAAPGVSAAQTPAPTTPGINLTVEDAVRLAEEHAPRLAEARAHEAAAESNLAALYASSRVSGAVSAGYRPFSWLIRRARALGRGPATSAGVAKELRTYCRLVLSPPSFEARLREW